MMNARMSPTSPVAIEPPALTADDAIAEDHDPAPATTWSLSATTTDCSHGGTPVPFAGCTNSAFHSVYACWT